MTFLALGQSSSSVDDDDDDDDDGDGDVLDKQNNLNINKAELYLSENMTIIRRLEQAGRGKATFDQRGLAKIEPTSPSVFSKLPFQSLNSFPSCQSSEPSV